MRLSPDTDFAGDGIYNIIVPKNGLQQLQFHTLTIKMSKILPTRDEQSH